jgi:hypothetical protein
LPSVSGRAACYCHHHLTVTLALADAVESATLVALIATVAGLGTHQGAVYTPDVEIVPTVPLPPAMPLTFQVTAVLVLPVTVALNCCVLNPATEALVGETLTLIADGCDTATLTALDTPPSGLLTVTGTPLLAAEVAPLALSLVGESKVVLRDALPNLTTAPFWKPVPLRVSVKLPVCTWFGLMDVIAGNGAMVTAAAPMALVTALLRACTLTLAGDGTPAGAVKSPDAEMVPTLLLPP